MHETVILIFSVIFDAIRGILFPGVPLRCEEAPFKEVAFGWWDHIRYWVSLLEDSYAGYSWQIELSFHIVIGCSAIVVFGFFLFWWRVYRHNREKKKENKVREEYAEKFRKILASDAKMSRLMIATELDRDEKDLKKNSPYFYANILEEIRMDMQERLSLPNMQSLALATGVTDTFSDNLLRNKKVFQTLQFMVMLQVTLNEGRLSKYRNHKRPDVRMMARLNYIMCTTDNPYLYLGDDLDDTTTLYEPMLLHYVFGWMSANKRKLPNFLFHVENTKIDTSAAFMLNEVRFWGKGEEKARVKEFLRDERPLVRRAAVQIVGELGDISAEEILTDIYPDEPEDIKQDILYTILKLNSGLQADFLKEAYQSSASRETQVVALQCMYQYEQQIEQKKELKQTIPAKEETVWRPKPATAQPRNEMKKTYATSQPETRRTLS